MYEEFELLLQRCNGRGIAPSLQGDNVNISVDRRIARIAVPPCTTMPGGQIVAWEWIGRQFSPVKRVSTI
ncbi:hypothetical protein N7447_008796 [Penicillium robsamsonii]|uniref:uncharacterized protein n=1 Tax=Penicillium robsamsonii TaxID=1792511 RepID=UPI00254921F4|nr:uncharacterized protein N7447_008796 [Penicillium robsamsonii]KAJ5816563.1 hypothetical protein N7447_008796 [Penicillium robsamsonii]